MGLIFRWVADETLLNNLVAGFSMPVLLVVGAFCLFVLAKGADWMIDGVVHLSLRTGLPKVVIGATVISLGTTAPEAAVSVMAAFMGNPGLALGNAVGSIIANAGLIFGVACILAAVPVDRYILDRTGRVMIGSAAMLVAVSFLMLFIGEPVLGRPVGIFFLVLLGVYMFMAFKWSKGGGDLTSSDDEEEAEELMGLFKCWVMLVGGLFLVVLAARVMVATASETAMRFGVPEEVIAATLVALGTSLPELMTAITSIRKGHPEICVGNVVGANVLNSLFVIGAAATAESLVVPSSFFYFHYPVMMFMLIGLFFFISINKDGWFKRWQGVCLLGLYLCYIIVQYTGIV